MSIYNRKLYNEALYQSTERELPEVDDLTPDGWQARIYDSNLQLKAVLKTQSWSYNQKINSATDIEITVPKNELREVLPAEGRLFQELARPQTEHLTLANFVQIWKGDSLKASGKITGRGISSNSITIKALTEEILLENNRTPAQYGEVLSGLDIADIARNITDGWANQRYAVQSNWEQNIGSSNVDLSTEPGMVLLSNYSADGYIIVRFDKNEYSDFKEWDRIRWSGDYSNEDGIYTTIQYRYGADETSLSSWSQEYYGGLTDEVGVVPEATTEQLLDVKINLSSDSTDTTPAFFAVESIARTGFDIQVGNIPNSIGLIVSEVEADYSNCLELLQTACEDTATTFEVTNRELNLYTDYGRKLTDSVLLREGDNIEIENLSDNDEDIVNYVVAIGAEGEGGPIDRPYYQVKNQNSIDEFGLYDDVLELDVTAQDELEFIAKGHLEEKAFPQESFQVQAYNFEQEPFYRPKDRVKVSDPESGRVIDISIDEISVEYDGSFDIRLDMNKVRKRLIQGIIEPDKITQRKRAQFVISFETVWQESDYPNPFYYDLYPSTDLYPSDDLYPAINPEDAAVAMAALDENMNELDRVGYRTRTGIGYDTETIGAKYYLSFDPGLVDDVAYLAWFAGASAIEEPGTGYIMDVREFEPSGSFIPVSKIDTKGW